jgi:hypothetical protein
MPRNKVNNLITDQEMAFARLVLAGTMTDREAAETAGLKPDTAAYTKAKPRVRAYMLEHRAATQRKLQQQESEEQRRKEQLREKVLDRLWEIAKMPPERTRNSITGQMKAIAMIAAIESLIPDRRAGAAANKSAPPIPEPDIYRAKWLREQQEKTTDPQPGPVPAPEPEEPAPAQPKPTPAAAQDAPPSPAMPLGPAYDRNQSAFAHLFHPAETPPSVPQRPAFDFARDTRVPLWLQRIPAARRPR